MKNFNRKNIKIKINKEEIGKNSIYYIVNSNEFDRFNLLLKNELKRSGFYNTKELLEGYTNVVRYYKRLDRAPSSISNHEPRRPSEEDFKRYNEVVYALNNIVNSYRKTA